MPALHYRFMIADWEEELSGAERRTTEWSPIAGAIGEVMVNRVNENFQTSGDGQWPALSPATLLGRAREEAGGKGVTKGGKGGGRTLTVAAVRAVAEAKPLIKSAAGLYQTIAYEIADGHVDAGSNLVYAAHQFFGSKPEWRWRIPARNPLYLKPSDETEIMRMYMEWVAGPLQ